MITYDFNKLNSDSIDEVRLRIFSGDRNEQVEVLIEGEKIIMSLKYLTFNALLFKTLLISKILVKKDYLVLSENIPANIIDEKINLIISLLDDNNLSINEHDKLLARTIMDLVEFSTKLNNNIGNTVSLYELTRLYSEDDEIKELFDYKIPSGLEFHEIDSVLQEKQNRIVEILSEKDSVFKPYFVAQNGINAKQFKQSVINIGLKPSITGTVMPIPINSSFLRGINTVDEFYINSIGGRKALITNFKMVKQAGYLNRKLCILTLDTILGEDDYCDSVNHLAIKIDSKATFERFNKRYYFRNGDDEYSIINTKKSTFEEFRDETIFVRSPVTCNSKKGICKACYGKLADINTDIHIGLLGVLNLTSKLTQSLLSTKHLLQTDSKKIEWSEKFLEFLEVDRDKISLKNSAKGNYFIFMKNEDIYKSEETGLEKVKDIYILKKGEEPILISNEIEFDISESFLELIQNNKDSSGDIAVKFKDINSMEMFTTVVDNNEIVDSLLDILKLIENKDHKGIDDYNILTQKFIELLNQNKIAIDSVHIENIVRELIRLDGNRLKRLDFSQEELPPYEILKLTDAIIDDDKVLRSISFERIKKQLISPVTYQKEGSSYLDFLFK